ncbi:uncharacterized protein LOC102157260 [Canis lupus familiaris]|uniref:uncharacterized protein LOC102157260 n=1 Tax=Canis lupus familiaris TaxID=9615 RepID=UPI0018F29608|nr:uncharacterized protein LOC102157260 [Canis lupus familiaris]
MRTWSRQSAGSWVKVVPVLVEPMVPCPDEEEPPAPMATPEESIHSFAGPEPRAPGDRAEDPGFPRDRQRREDTDRQVTPAASPRVVQIVPYPGAPRPLRTGSCKTGRELEGKGAPAPQAHGAPAQGLPGRDPRLLAAPCRLHVPSVPPQGAGASAWRGASDRPDEVQPDGAAGARSPTTAARLAVQGRHLHFHLFGWLSYIRHHGRGAGLLFTEYGYIVAACGDNDSVLQCWKLAISCMLEIWLDYYRDDFCQLPAFPSLRKLLQFLSHHLPGSDVEVRAGVTSGNSDASMQRSERLGLRPEENTVNLLWSAPQLGPWGLLPRRGLKGSRPSWMLVLRARPALRRLLGRRSPCR